MTSNTNARGSDREPCSDVNRMAQAMEEYLAELESGARPDRERFLARYPDIAVELTANLEGIELLHIATPRLKANDGKPVLSGNDIHPLATIGDYRIVRELGRGGMGVVYEAEQLSLGRSVALKVLPFASLLDERQLKRFQNEARAMALLDHPHIVPIYGFGVDRSVHYYAMRLIDGHSLDHVLRELRRQRGPNPKALVPSDTFALGQSHVHSGEVGSNTVSLDNSNQFDDVQLISRDSLPTSSTNRETMAAISTHLSSESSQFYRSVARIGMQAAEGLAHAHENGVLHRDIKPANLLIDARGGLWVSDFGLAQIKSDLRLTRCGDVVGTLRYMSPEQLSGKATQVDERSDVYSLGATLYELATLQPLFMASDRQQLIKQIGVELPPPPRQLNKQVPTALSTIIHKCIQREPSERFANAQDLADELRRFLQDQPILTRPPRVTERIARWLRHHRSMAWTASTVLAMIACGLALSTAIISRSRNEAIYQRDLAQKQQALVVAGERSLRQHQYAADMRLAWEIWTNAQKGNDRIQVQHLHSRYDKPSDAEVQSFAWYYLRRLCVSKPTIMLEGHVGAVYNVNFSPDGRMLATAGKDKTARLWDVDTFEERFVLRGHQDEVNCVTFSPDGRTLATSSDDRTIKFWDTATGQERLGCTIPKFEFPVRHIEFSMDGKWLVASEYLRGRDGVVIATTVWDVATCRINHRMSDSYGLAIAPDSDTLVIARAGTKLQLVSLTDGTKRGILNADVGQPLAACFCENGHELVVCGHGGFVSRLDLRTRQVIHKYKPFDDDGEEDVDYSRDNKWLASGGCLGATSLFDVRTGELRQSFVRNTERAWSVKFSPDTNFLVACKNDGKVEFWNTSSSNWLNSVPIQPEPISAMSISSDGDLLAVASPNRAPRFWKLRSIATEQVDVTDVPADTVCLSFCPIGQRLAVARANGSVFLIDPFDSKQKLKLTGPGPSIGGLVFTNDGRVLAGGSENAVHFWDTTTGLEFQSLSIAAHNPGPHRMAFSPNGKHGVFQSALDIDCFDFSRQRRDKFPTGHSQELNCVCYSPDGRVFVTGSDDMRIKVWDAATCQELYTLRGHQSDVKCLTFSPDGKTLASGGQDLVVKIWDVATRQELLNLTGHTGIIRHLAFSRDGQTLVSVGDAEQGTKADIRIWHAPR